jgi:hypothetical protein
MTGKSDEVVRLVLRLPRELHRKLVQAAASNSPPNSLNTEILRRLYDSDVEQTDLEADTRNRNAADPLMETVQKMQKRIRELEKKIGKSTDL